VGYTYDADGRVTQETLNGTDMADPTYNATSGQLTSVAYPGNSATTALTPSYGSTGALDQEVWAFASGQTGISDADTLSQSGRVLQDSIQDGTSATYASSYTYDAAGRLTSATVPQERPDLQLRVVWWVWGEHRGRGGWGPDRVLRFH
jgi:YD repeat-containing protein